MKNKNGNKISIATILIILFFISSYVTGRAVFQERVVEIPQNIMTDFNNIYENNQEETTRCVRGEKTLEGWKISNIYEPTIISTQVNTMKYEACGSDHRYADVIGTWHMHPRGLCELSDSDMFSFGGDYYQYGLELTIVQCSINKMGIFSKDIIFAEGYTFEQDSMKYKII
ncbi:MAG: hypothetical protein PHD81_04760 [Candidatus Nanoarchaeia archaeon]|nr:hypothetical protein [Candidatus Nanoarchaeia archaeon]MDD5588388.1 hypothetical protein [Candidatus Nanoarchaeia archaeon]